MNCLFVLSKDYPDLARAEAQSLVGKAETSSCGNWFIFSVSKTSLSKVEQASLIQSSHEILFSCPVQHLEEKMGMFNWKSVYKENFSVRVHDLKKSRTSLAKTLAKQIWISVDSPKVRMNKSKTPIDVFLGKDAAWVTKRLWTSTHDVQKRKAQHLPFFHSGAIHPKLARACVNILGAKKSETVYDPFCGAGGFLIEAGLMGLHVKGSDIHEKMVWGCMENLQSFTIQGNIFTHDFLLTKDDFDYMVSDLPYGLQTIIQGQGQLRQKNVNKVSEFYAKVLAHVKKHLKKRAVIIFPNFVDHKKLLRDSKLTLKQEFTVYVHKSLSRKICLVTP